MNTTAFITGGSRGLGRNTALALAAQGTDVVFTYHSNEAAAKETLQAITDAGARAAYLQLDVRQPDSFATLVEHLQAQLQAWSKPGLDYLVNNAGVGAHMPIGQGAADTLDTLYNVHFKGVYLLTEALLPMLQSGGAIVNISTGLTRFALPGYGAYAAMKGAAEVYTKYLAKELGSRGIRANAVAPGAIDNDFNAAAFEHHPEIKTVIADNTALGRVGESEDIGKVVAFLCSDRGAWVNAQRLEASGGMFL